MLPYTTERDMILEILSHAWKVLHDRNSKAAQFGLIANAGLQQYVQKLPESVKQMAGSVYTMLRKGGEVQEVSGDLLPNATKAAEQLAVSC